MKYDYQGSHQKEQMSHFQKCLKIFKNIDLGEKPLSLTLFIESISLSTIKHIFFGGLYYAFTD